MPIFLPLNNYLYGGRTIQHPLLFNPVEILNCELLQAKQI